MNYDLVYNSLIEKAKSLSEIREQQKKNGVRYPGNSERLFSYALLNY
jgi:hypothetical protein